MKDKTILVTGGAGFIGSHLVDALIEKNHVIVYDNLSSGKIDFIKNHFDNPRFKFIKGDLLDKKEINNALNVDIVYHCAANPDVRTGMIDPKVHLEQNIIATHNLLEGMRENDVDCIIFPSTSTVYGDALILPTPEDYGPLLPISLYGASKLGCEALISAYCHTFDMRACIFRFANVVGERGTHGVIVDFIDKLRKNPRELEILGDGTQTKSYIHIKDCVDAILFGVEKARERVEIYNIGSEDQITVKEIAEIVCNEMGLKNVRFKYTGGFEGRGWKGDVKLMLLDIKKIKERGWKPKFNSREAIRDAVRSLL
ncbi:MAG: NAD-dependent epimerase/dehydratase family protein [Candidatus Hydrothermarchaeota archaeon]